MGFGSETRVLGMHMVPSSQEFLLLSDPKSKCCVSYDKLIVQAEIVLFGMTGGNLHWLAVNFVNFCAVASTSDYMFIFVWLSRIY